MVKHIVPIVAVVALALPAAAGAKPAGTAHAAIVGGHNATISKWPSIAYLLGGYDEDGDKKNDAFNVCTGTVIAPRWIVTAAHCAFDPDDKPIRSMVTLTGVSDTTAHGGESIAADRLVVDPDWDPDTAAGDMLLIHLKSPSSRPAMQVAEPGGNYASKPDVPNAAGWGDVDEDSTVETDVLQEAYLELRDAQTCAAFTSDFDPATQTCAGTPDKAGVCHGDSGGPLIVWDKATGAPVLWGVTSYGPQPELGMKPCQLDAPAVFSWLPGFAGFVKQAFESDAPAAGIAPAPDTTAPVLSRVRLSKRTFTRRGARLSFDVSEAAAVKLTILKRGHRRFKAVSSIPLAASAGHITRRLPSRKLKRGRYKLRLVAVDAAGNESRSVAKRFSVVG